MKKLIYLLSILIATSCKKEYTCECTDSETGPISISTSTKAKSTKKDAEAWCNSIQSVSYGNKKTCQLK